MSFIGYYGANRINAYTNNLSLALNLCASEAILFKKLAQGIEVIWCKQESNMDYPHGEPN